MKSYLIVAVVLAVSTFILVSCADQSPNESASNTNPAQRTYDQSDLQRTGRGSTGEAVSKLDPAVQVSGNR